ncbi:predicted protein [Streptomyces filamentosus NRRL 15998]|uniref:Predicted protein n=1 Tax=Streptomyces filamentosus NRRL 15998 TaxID=457431 RepID=D6AUG9_STRFL|nr:predicted protein [Streptomyces filamentosus NRRL 15998]
MRHKGGGAAGYRAVLVAPVDRSRKSVSLVDGSRIMWRPWHREVNLSKSEVLVRIRHLRHPNERRVTGD